MYITSEYLYYNFLFRKAMPNLLLPLWYSNPYRDYNKHRVLVTECLSLRQNWVPPPKSECVSPLGPTAGEQHSLVGDGWDPVPTKGQTLCMVLCILCVATIFIDYNFAYIATVYLIFNSKINGFCYLSDLLANYVHFLKSLIWYGKDLNPKIALRCAQDNLRVYNVFASRNRQ